MPMLSLLMRRAWKRKATATIARRGSEMPSPTTVGFNDDILQYGNQIKKGKECRIFSVWVA